MNDATATALAGAPLPQQRPASPPALTATKAVATGGASGLMVRDCVLDGTQDARVLHPDVLSPSHWPDLILERIFRELNIGDLVACSQVCRRWQQLAGTGNVQMKSLLQTYTPRHRQQMERALDSNLVRTNLMPWCDNPASAPERVPAATVARGRTAQDLLCSALQRMLLTECFHPGVFHESTLSPGFMQDLLCSPDGRMIASVQQAWGVPKGTVNLWEDAAAPIGFRPGPPTVNRKICQLAFGSDGSKLRVLYRNGMVEVRQPHQEGGWYTASSTRLFADLVHKSVLSPDGKHLAVVLRGSVRIYREGGQGGWKAEPESVQVWPWGNGIFTEYDPDQIVMGFSDAGYHFVLGIEYHALFWIRLGDDSWAVEPRNCSRPVRGEPVFDLQNRLVVLTACYDSEQGLSVPVAILLFRWGEVSEEAAPLRWEHVTEIGALRNRMLCTSAHPRTGYKAPVAFSPDGELMALLHHEDCQKVCVIVTTGPAAWNTGFVLRDRPKTKEPDSWEPVLSLQFSANSRYLAVGTDGTLTLWGRFSGWQMLLRINDSTRRAGVPFAFSPDGFHCVTSHVLEGRDSVRIWGPVSGGAYGCKLSRTLACNTRVEKLLFTPDATRILIAVSCRDLVQKEGGVHQDFRFGSRLFYWHLVPSKVSSPVSEPVHNAGAGPA